MGEEVIVYGLRIGVYWPGTEHKHRVPDYTAW